MHWRPIFVFFFCCAQVWFFDNFSHLVAHSFRSSSPLLFASCFEVILGQINNRWLHENNKLTSRIYVKRDFSPLLLCLFFQVFWFPICCRSSTKHIKMDYYGWYPLLFCWFHLFLGIECDFLLTFCVRQPNGVHHKMLLKITNDDEEYQQLQRRNVSRTYRQLMAKSARSIGCVILFANCWKFK